MKFFWSLGEYSPDYRSYSAHPRPVYLYLRHIIISSGMLMTAKMELEIERELSRFLTSYSPPALIRFSVGFILRFDHCLICIDPDVRLAVNDSNQLFRRIYSWSYSFTCPRQLLFFGTIKALLKRSNFERYQAVYWDLIIDIFDSKSGFIRVRAAPRRHSLQSGL